MWDFNPRSMQEIVETKIKGSPERIRTAVLRVLSSSVYQRFRLKSKALYLN
jgi:hypothetical protein